MAPTVQFNQSSWIKKVMEMKGTAFLEYFYAEKNKHEISQGIATAARDTVPRIMRRIQEGLGEYAVGDYRHTRLLENLYSIQQATGQLLPGVELKSGEVRRDGSNPVADSAFFDIWKGKYLGQETCTIKAIRAIEVSPTVRARFLKETKIWREVRDMDKGQHILPFWGARLLDGDPPWIVGPWMEYGDATSFVNSHPNVNRKRIIRQVAEGLKFLHTHDPSLVHGNIRGANILIDWNGNPLLADFGLLKIVANVTGKEITEWRGLSESYRWLAPELFLKGVLTPASDVYAYAMTILELMTGQPPFSHIRRNQELLGRMIAGERPHRPGDSRALERGLDDKLWNLLKRCWVAEPERRPSIQDVLKELP